MDFQKLLLDVGKALCRDEVKALAFLCSDLLGQNPATVETAFNLFSRLMDQDYLSAEQPHLLFELLYIIQRASIVRGLKLQDQVPTDGTLVSPYRRLLYSLSEDLTDSDLQEMKFLLNKDLPRRKLEHNVTTLEIFLEMEHMGLISHTNLHFLKTIVQEVCPMLTEKITQFEANDIPQTNQTAEEKGSPRSLANMFKPAGMPGERTLSGEIADLSHGLSNLSTEANRSTSSKADALKTFSDLNESPSRSPMSPTPHTNSALEAYPMAARKRGICLIINNYDFSKSEKYLQVREGTMVDQECLYKVFKWLGFEIEIQKDCKSERMLSLMRELSSRDHSQMDCVVCCILSHGKEESVYGVDGHTVAIRKMTEPFSGTNCSSLAKKPKLFFIQACQGTREQRAVYIEADGPRPSSIHSDAVAIKESIPADADFLLGMATVGSFASFRDRKIGTWFIQTLCRNLVHLVPRGIDLVSILTKVNADVSQKTDSTGVKKQMPQPAFSLTKRVIFPIPNNPPPEL